MSCTKSTKLSLSLEASDVQTDEDFEELTQRTTTRKRMSSKPPSSPRSPYLSSLKVGSKRVAVSAWRLPRASLGDASVASVDTLGAAASPCLTSLSNGHHGLSQSMRSEYDVTAQILNLTSRKHKQLRSTSNGRVDYGDKEEMYDENIRLKKSLVDQRTDNQQMKAKLRRLEEDTARREKQIEELLDPTKGPEYTRSFVDKNKEGGVVIKGLKQRILKLEQQCREKENALSKLQSELRTTNLEELKITVETYFEEIKRLTILLNAAEKSSRAETKGSQRHQKSLGATVLRLSESLKQLQLDNSTLREELSTDSPAEGIKGYREWSKQRLVRRLLELEKRLEAGRKHAPSAKSSCQSEQGVQTMPKENLDVLEAVTVATEEVVPVGTEDMLFLRGRVDGLEEERKLLKETLASKDVELLRLKGVIEDLEQETERWKDEQVKKHEKERNEHREEALRLRLRIQTLEEEDRERPAPGPAPEDPAPACPETPGTPQTGGTGPEDTEGPEGKGRTAPGRGNAEERRRRRAETRLKKERDKAARTIQSGWREHRDQDVVMLQSTLRGHLLRQAQLREPSPTDAKSVPPPSRGDHGDVCADGQMDVADVTTIQSVFRGHLVRCGRATQSSVSPMPSTEGSSPAIQVSGRHGSFPPFPPSKPAPVALHCEANPPRGATPIDSDDSDDIVVSPTRPLRSREKMLL
ncbi:IQ domain-containing protein E [Gadus macrocephalus]|uniref:IQ domain-containing protein E n=1 Tax=Gadus macrocephalus TaxID=80720 RepID=UPI0028CB9C26|nr:IQ domain-containing protein E [Gadus macrocephalus]